jgi:hypothetical protein
MATANSSAGLRIVPEPPERRQEQGTEHEHG